MITLPSAGVINPTTGVPTPVNGVPGAAFPEGWEGFDPLYWVARTNPFSFEPPGPSPFARRTAYDDWKELQDEQMWWSEVIFDIAFNSFLAIAPEFMFGRLALAGRLGVAAEVGAGATRGLTRGIQHGALEGLEIGVKNLPEGGTAVFEILRPGGTGNALAGHGFESALLGTTRTPRGTMVIAPPSGLRLPEAIGQAIEAGEWWRVAADPRMDALVRSGQWRVFEPLTEMPNLLLTPGTKPQLTMYVNSIRVREGVLIEQLLTENMGCMYWAACTVPFAPP
jgi:hypothetical protein